MDSLSPRRKISATNTRKSSSWTTVKTAFTLSKKTSKPSTAFTSPKKTSNPCIVFASKKPSLSSGLPPQVSDPAMGRRVSKPVDFTTLGYKSLRARSQSNRSLKGRKGDSASACVLMSVMLVAVIIIVVYFSFFYNKKNDDFYEIPHNATHESSPNNTSTAPVLKEAAKG